MNRFAKICEDSRSNNVKPSCWIDPNGKIIEIDHHDTTHEDTANELYGLESHELIAKGFILVTTLFPYTHFVLPSWNEQHKRRAAKFIGDYDWPLGRKISISTQTSSSTDAISGDWNSVFSELSESVIRESPLRPVHQKLLNLRSQFALVAQSVYDSWDQDEEGWDKDLLLGTGGICDQIVEGWYEIMNAQFDENEVEFQQGGQDGDDHAWLVVRVTDNFKSGKSEIYGVDINPFTYETGGGYSWKKRPGVKFSANDVEVFKV